MRISAALLTARVRARLFPAELEELADVDLGTVDAIEDDQREPTAAEVAALAGALGMAPSGLTGATS